jgi:recombination protein RecR
VTVLDRLVRNLTRLPGIGKKSAHRIAYYLLRADSHFTEQIAGDIARLQDSIRKCSVCGNYTEEDPCAICSAPGRDRSLICVVEQAQDIHTLEETGEFHGLYHVLDGAISPMEGVSAEDLAVDSLLQRIREGEVQELILATNPTVEGDTTALYLQRLLADFSVRVSRLATGLPLGGDLEYADRMTLARSLKGRTPL